MSTRTTFDPDLGDRVARKPGMLAVPATTWAEAIQYATERARQTGVRHQLRRHSRHGWWLVIAQRPGRGE